MEKQHFIPEELESDGYFYRQEKGKCKYRYTDERIIEIYCDRKIAIINKKRCEDCDLKEILT